MNDSISKFLEKNQKISNIMITNLFLDGERLYVQISLHLKNKNYDVTIKDVILSKGLEDSKVKVEKKLTKILLEKSKINTDYSRIYYEKKSDDVVLDSVDFN